MSKELSRRLRAILNERHISVTEVAKRLPGVSPAAVGHWFTGERTPQVQNLRLLADALDVKVERLLSDDPMMAETGQLSALLDMARKVSPAQLEAVLAILQTMQPKQ